MSNIPQFASVAVNGNFTPTRYPFGSAYNPGGSTLYQATVTLDNAQIKALPSVSWPVVPAPGSGKTVRVVTGRMIINTLAGAYTNVDSTALLFLFYSPAGVSASNNVEAQPNFEVASKRVIDLTPPGLSQTPPDFLLENSGAYADLDNTGLVFGIYNANTGDFTGGNAANTLQIAVTYTILTLS